MEKCIKVSAEIPATENDPGRSVEWEVRMDRGAKEIEIALSKALQGLGYTSLACRSKKIGSCG